MSIYCTTKTLPYNIPSGISIRFRFDCGRYPSNSIGNFESHHHRQSNDDIFPMLNIDSDNLSDIIVVEINKVHPIIRYSKSIPEKTLLILQTLSTSWSHFLRLSCSLKPVSNETLNAWKSTNIFIERADEECRYEPYYQCQSSSPASVTQLKWDVDQSK